MEIVAVALLLFPDLSACPPREHVMAEGYATVRLFDQLRVTPAGDWLKEEGRKQWERFYASRLTSLNAAECATRPNAVYFLNDGGSEEVYGRRRPSAAHWLWMMVHFATYKRSP